MHKIFLILFLTTFSSVLSAQKPVAPRGKTSEREMMIAKLEYTLEAAQIYDFLRKSISQIDKGKTDGKALTRLDYHAFKTKIKGWIDYRWFIADTGLSKRWLKSIYELMVYIAKTKSYIDAAKFSGNTKNKKYPQAVKYFDVAYERLVNLAKKPVKVSSKVQRRSKLKKALWQKAMRKKYKIKENVQTVEF